MTKRCRKSILCHPRRGRCCLGGAVSVVLHFRHFRVALSSAEALRGVSTNSQRLSPNQAIHLSSMKAEHQTNRCCAVSFSSPQNPRLLSSDQRAPAAEGRVVASPEERDLHSPLVTAHSVLLFSLPRPISRFIRGNGGQGPTESSWSISPVSMHTGRSTVPPVFPLRSLPPSLLLGITVGDQSKATSILPSSQLPRRLLCHHGLRLKRAVFDSRCGSPRAQLVSSLLHYHTSPSLCLLPRRTRVKDTPLLFRLLSARCSCGFSTRGSKTFWHLCLQLSLFVLCLASLWATSLLLSPLAAPSIYHTDIELRRHACRRLSPVPPLAGLLLWVYF